MPTNKKWKATYQLWKQPSKLTALSLPVLELGGAYLTTGLSSLVSGYILIRDLPIEGRPCHPFWFLESDVFGSFIGKSLGSHNSNLKLFYALIY